MAKDLQFTFRRACLELSGEVGSLAELIGYMQEESTALTMAFGDDMELVVQRINNPNSVSTTVEPAKTRKPRTPKQEAVAPEPLPVPVSAAPPLAPVPPSAAALAMPSPVAPDLALAPDGGIPPFLARTAPLPALPVSPPPVGTLGPKVVKAMDLLVATAPDGGQAMADWLAASGLTIRGKSYDDACRAVLMISDEKLKDVADALNV